MSGQSDDPTEQLGEELRALLTALIGTVTPLVAQIAPDASAPQASCTWCPVCALVALARGEQHPLLTAIGTQGVALLTVLRDLLADSVGEHSDVHPATRADGDGDGGDEAPGSGAGEPDADGAAHVPDDSGSRPRFERIAVAVHRSGDRDPL